MAWWPVVAVIFGLIAFVMAYAMDNAGKPSSATCAKWSAPHEVTLMRTGGTTSSQQWLRVVAQTCDDWE